MGTGGGGRKQPSGGGRKKPSGGGRKQPSGGGRKQPSSGGGRKQPSGGGGRKQPTDDVDAKEASELHASMVFLIGLSARPTRSADPEWVKRRFQTAYLTHPRDLVNKVRATTTGSAATTSGSTAATLGARGYHGLCEWT